MHFKKTVLLKLIHNRSVYIFSFTCINEIQNISVLYAASLSQLHTRAQSDLLKVDDIAEIH